MLLSNIGARVFNVGSPLQGALVLLTLLGVLIAFPGGIRAATPDANVSIVDGAYKPAALTVAQHTAVFWHNDGSSKHTVTADDGSFESGALNPGDVFGNVFDVAGTFAYHDANDPSGMQGTITVTPVSATPAPTGPTPPPGTLPPDFHTPVPAPTDTPPPGTPATSPNPINGEGQAVGLINLAPIGLLLVAVVALIAIASRRRRRGKR